MHGDNIENGKETKRKRKRRRESEISHEFDKSSRVCQYLPCYCRFASHSLHIRSGGGRGAGIAVTVNRDSLHLINTRAENRRFEMVKNRNHRTPQFSIIIRLNPIKITHRQTNCETMCFKWMPQWFRRDDSADLKSIYIYTTHRRKALNRSTRQNVLLCTKINSPFQIKTQTVDWAIVDTSGLGYHVNQSIWFFFHMDWQTRLNTLRLRFKINIRRFFRAVRLIS